MRRSSSPTLFDALPIERRRAALYLRVSTQDQTVANQLPDLKRFARARGFEIAETYEEHASAVGQRPELSRLREAAHARKFDVVLVWALDRLGRSLFDNVRTVLELERAGVDVLSVREPWLDTKGPVRDLLLAIFSWVAQHERTRLVERTRAGVARARAQGKKLGRPRVGVSHVAVDVLWREGKSATSIARQLGISRASVYRLLVSKSPG